MERTDLDRFSVPPAPLVVVLGGREFALAIQRKGQTAQFRKKLRACLGTVDGLVSTLQALIAAADEDRDVPLSELPVEQIVNAVLGFLGDGANELLDLVYGYDTALEAERGWIDANAYDAEFCEALVAIVKVVFGPFLHVLLPGMKTATTPATTAE